MIQERSIVFIDKGIISNTGKQSGFNLIPNAFVVDELRFDISKYVKKFKYIILRYKWSNVEDLQLRAIVERLGYEGSVPCYFSFEVPQLGVFKTDKSRYTLSNGLIQKNGLALGDEFCTAIFDFSLVNPNNYDKMYLYFKTSVVSPDYTKEINISGSNDDNYNLFDYLKNVKPQVNIFNISVSGSYTQLPDIQQRKITLINNTGTLLRVSKGAPVDADFIPLFNGSYFELICENSMSEYYVRRDDGVNVSVTLNLTTE